MHASVCDFILDCIQNSVEAGASEIMLNLEESGEKLKVLVSDNGCGMNEDELKSVIDPFYTDGKKHSKRKVGLGLPFLVQAVDQAGGSYRLDSEKGTGTEIEFMFPMDNIDTPPLGDITGLFLQAMMFDGNYDFIVNRKYSGSNGSSEYSIKRSEIIEVLGDLNDAASLLSVRQYIRSQEDDVKGDK